jgi:dihydrofolate reductase
VRTVVVSNIASVDGYFAAQDGNPLVLDMDAAFDAYNRERIAAADVVLLGRTSFLGFSSYWPSVADAPADPGNRALSDDNREISRAYGRLPKVVVSDTLEVPRDNPWHPTTTVVPRAAVASELDRLRTGGDGDVLVFASHVLWNALLAEGLVDELHIMVSPVALGAGVPLLTGPARLALLGTRRFDGSDNLLVRYAPR